MNYRAISLKIAISGLNSINYSIIKKATLTLLNIDTTQFSAFENNFIDTFCNKLYSFNVGTPIVQNHIIEYNNDNQVFPTEVIPVINPDELNDYLSYNATYKEQISYIAPLAVLTGGAKTLIKEYIPTPFVLPLRVFSFNPIDHALIPGTNYLIEKVYKEIAKEFIPSNDHNSQNPCTAPDFEYNGEVFFIQYDLKNSFSPTYVNNSEALFEEYLNCIGTNNNIEIEA